MEGEDDHSPTSSVDIKNRWNYTATPLCLQDVHRDNSISVIIILYNT
jgi:hypothetical protein